MNHHLEWFSVTWLVLNDLCYSEVVSYSITVVIHIIARTINSGKRNNSIIQPNPAWLINILPWQQSSSTIFLFVLSSLQFIGHIWAYRVYRKEEVWKVVNLFQILIYSWALPKSMKQTPSCILHLIHWVKLE